MKDDSSDPKIVERLKKLPPFDDEEETIPDPPQEAPQELVEETTPAVEPPKTPEETEDERKKRTTEEFEKLKAHNAELKRQLEERKAAEPPRKNALDDIMPTDPVLPITNQVPTTQQFPNLSNKEIKDTFSSLTDDQGYVDTGLLKETLLSLDQRAKEAEARAARAEEDSKKSARRMDDFERKQLMRQVHAMYPKLDPENETSDDPDKKWDERIYKQFQKEVMYQWTTKGKEDVWAAAKDSYDTILGDSMRKADKEKAERAELAKRNINASSAGRTNVNTYKDTDDLIMATRKNRPGALAERLRRAGQ